MRLRNEAKVGLVVFAGIVALLVIYWFLGGLGLRSSSYPIYAVFPNAQKLDKGALVRLAGVKIGMVSEMTLTRSSRARVDMLIWKDNELPRDSIARITVGGFIGDNYVEIDPGRSKTSLKPNQQIRSENLAQPEEILEQVGELLTEFKTSTQGINQLLGDKKMLAMIKDTIAAVDKAAQSTVELAEATKKMAATTRPRIARVIGNIEDVSARAARVSSELEDMMAKDVRPNVKSLLDQTNTVMKHLDASVTDAGELIKSITPKAGSVDETFTKLSKALDNAIAASDQATEMLKKLNEASGGIRDIATDPELKAGLLKTVKNAAEASEQAKCLITNLNRKYGGGGGANAVQKRAVPELGVSSNSLWNTNTGKYRFDAYYTGMASVTDFYRGGAYNIGNSTKVILQGGKVLDPDDSLRYGIYASQVGFGYDRHLGGSGLLSFDLFKPNDLQLEARGVVKVADGIGLYAGCQDLLHPDNRDVLVGIRYNK